MTMPGKQVHIRLPDDLAQAFDRLCEELPGLQPGAVMRGLLADQLRKPTEQQVSIVVEQLKKSPKLERAKGRIDLNTQRHTKNE